MWFRTVWVNKHWKCPPAVRSIYFLPRAGLGINTQLSHKHTKQQISLMFPQNIHHLFVPREKEESDREMRMSNMPVLGGSFSWPAGLCLKWTPGPVSSPDPCMGNHTSLCRLQATTSNSSCTTKRREKKRGRNLRCSFLMASALTSDIVKDNRHPGNCNTTWWNMERIICFYYKSRVFVSSPHISGTFSFNTEWLRCLIGKLFWEWVFLHL